MFLLPKLYIIICTAPKKIPIHSFNSLRIGIYNYKGFNSAALYQNFDSALERGIYNATAAIIEKVPLINVAGRLTAEVRTAG